MFFSQPSIRMNCMASLPFRRPEKGPAQDRPWFFLHGFRTVRKRHFGCIGRPLVTMLKAPRSYCCRNRWLRPFQHHRTVHIEPSAAVVAFLRSPDIPLTITSTTLFDFWPSALNPHSREETSLLLTVPPLIMKGRRSAAISISPHQARFDERSRRMTVIESVVLALDSQLCSHQHLFDDTVCRKRFVAKEKGSKQYGKTQSRFKNFPPCKLSMDSRFPRL